MEGRRHRCGSGLCRSSTQQDASLQGAGRWRGGVQASWPNVRIQLDERLQAPSLASIHVRQEVTPYLMDWGLVPEEPHVANWHIPDPEQLTTGRWVVAAC